MKLSTIARTLRDLLHAGDEPSQRLDAMRRCAQRLVPGYRCLWPDIDWWKSESFNAYLDATSERDGFNTHRRWMVAQLLRLIEGVPGDTAECGVYKGASSYLICQSNAASSQSRHHHMFDSFEGISAPVTEDGEYWKSGDLATGIEPAEQLLHAFAQKTFYTGWIPERFSEVAERAFAFVHVDVDVYDPTRDSIAFFYPRLSPGGILLCDDYAFPTCPGATQACDEFLDDKPEAMIALSAGGGFLIKGVATAENEW